MKVGREPPEVPATEGLDAGDDVEVEAAIPRIEVPTRVDDPVLKYAGSEPGVYPPDYLEELRAEWPD